MLVHDQYSGYVHEVPDQLYGLGEVYDGLGNPMGLPFLSALAPLASAVLPSLAPIVSRIPGIGNLVGGALQNVGQLAQGAGNMIGQAARLPFNIAGQGISATGQAIANLPGMPGFAPPVPAAAMPRPWPLGWIRQSLPYTGLGPRRLYMRCAVWPGPQGLVPGYAANMPPGAQAAMPGFPGMPALPGMPVMPGPFRGGRRRHRR